MKKAETPWNETFWVNQKITSQDSQSKCMSFGYKKKSNFDSYGYQLDNCEEEKQFLCKRSPLGKLAFLI